MARHIVSTVLGVPVDRFEDGTANSQVDALVHYPDRVAALEVVADHEPAYNAQTKALARVDDRVEVSGLRQAWTSHSFVSLHSSVGVAIEDVTVSIRRLETPIRRQGRV